MTTTSRPQFLTPAQLSDRWGGMIGPRTLANWRSQGNGPPFVKIGGAIAYRLADVEAYEAKQTVSSTSQYGALRA